MGKMTQKIARSLGDRLGRAINYALYDTRYKKVYLRIRECEDKSPHPDHVWAVEGGYIRPAAPNYYFCEG